MFPGRILRPESSAESIMWFQNVSTSNEIFTIRNLQRGVVTIAQASWENNRLLYIKAIDLRKDSEFDADREIFEDSEFQLSFFSVPFCTKERCNCSYSKEAKFEKDETNPNFLKFQKYCVADGTSGKIIAVSLVIFLFLTVLRTCSKSDN